MTDESGHRRLGRDDPVDKKGTKSTQRQNETIGENPERNGTEKKAKEGNPKWGRRWVRRDSKQP